MRAKQRNRRARGLSFVQAMTIKRAVRADEARLRSRGLMRCFACDELRSDAYNVPCRHCGEPASTPF